MMTLIVTFPHERIVFSAASADVFWNVDYRGITRCDPIELSVKQAPLRLFPGQDVTPKWGQDAWGTGPWGGLKASSAIAFETPAVHFRAVEIAGRARDEPGNLQPDAMIVAEKVVNSTPLPPSHFARGEYAGGRQTFSFVESPQLEVL